MDLTPSPVKVAALELGIPVQTPIKARAPDFVEFIESLEADALIVASYGQILSERLLNAAQRGGINLHGSILPKYRGAAPIQRAIEAGDQETGTTLMQMDKGMDTGAVIAEIRTPIGEDETYGELHERLAHLSADLLMEWINRIVAGDYQAHVQDHVNATHAAKITREDQLLDFSNDAIREYNRFRAFTPNPGVFIETSLGKVKIHTARHTDRSGVPGEVIATSPHLVLAFHGTSLEIHELQPEGKKRMSGRDYANGARIQVGDQLRPNPKHEG